MVSVVSCHKFFHEGFGSSDFHSKCDGHANTLTIFKAKESKFIFGGLTSVRWDSLSGDELDRNIFIFSITNNDDEPLKMKINPNRPEVLFIVILNWVHHSVMIYHI